MAKSIAAVITAEEFKTMKLYELDDVIFNRVMYAFRRFMGDKAHKFIQNNINKTLRELSTCKFVDVMQCFTIV